MKNLPEGRVRWLRVRIALLALLLVSGAGSVLHRAWELQIERGTELRRMAEQQYLRQLRHAPKRGSMYDRHGAALAVSVDVDSVWANPRVLKGAGWTPERATRRLADVLDLHEDVIQRRLASDRYFVWIERHITPKQAAKVRALDIPGVSMSKEARRYYPNRELASHVLGFANIDGVGIEGLELGLEDRLKGHTEVVEAVRDRQGRVVYSELLFNRAAQGDDVYLTLDKSIQRVAERELELAVRTFEAAAGSVVVMDPRSGELLAMASYPTFNPNRPGRAPVAHRRNRAITDRFEPGSTIKPFTVAGALAVGAIKPNQPIDCGDGAMKVAEHTIHDSHRWERLTPGDVLKHSSNIGTANIGLALGRAGLYRALRRFGFGQQMGVPLPGETEGILRHYKKWYEMDAATISFGQGMSATALQLTSAMAAIANGGKLVRPALVRHIVDGRGEQVDTHEPQVRRQVIPRWAARLTADMLTKVTDPDGTGVEAAIDGYRVAGKTGTAQKADYVSGGYAKDKWTASFVGFVPARNPRVVISVTIDEPVIAHYGGTVAAPVFRRVAEAALRHLGVPPARSGSALAELAAKSKAKTRDKARGKTTRQVNSAEDKAATARTATTPAAKPSVPDVSGFTGRHALVALRSEGLEGRIRGSGVVVRQTPAAGHTVARGSYVDLVLAPPPHVAPPATDVAEVDSMTILAQARQERAR